MKDKITLERRWDHNLRADEYTVVSQDQDGEEVQFFVFYVTKKGMIWNIGEPEDVPS